MLLFDYIPEKICLKKGSSFLNLHFVKLFSGACILLCFAVSKNQQYFCLLILYFFILLNHLMIYLLRLTSSNSSTRLIK